jgi:glycerophosphoryl diester phosphodiesterase
VIAHRGNSSEAPENTFASFESAIALGARIVECDVQMTADGELVVIHDPTLDRTTDRAGDVRAMTLAEVRAANANYPATFGDRFPRQAIPTLAELLQFLRGRATLMLEVKPESSRGGDDDSFEREVARVVARSGLRLAPDITSEVALISFSTTVVTRLGRLIPEAPRGHIFYRVPADAMFDLAARARVRFIMPEKADLLPGIFAGARERGLELATWVSDDEAEFRHLLTLHLLGIGTNRPRAMLPLLPP